MSRRSRRKESGGNDIDFDFFDEDGPPETKSKSKTVTVPQTRSTESKSKKKKSSTESRNSTSSDSDSYSESEVSNTERSIHSIKKIRAKIPTAQSDTESDLDTGRSGDCGPSPKTKHSLSDELDERHGSERPKTGVRRAGRVRSSRSESSSTTHSQSRSRSNSASSSCSETESNSDGSDITDVSPLASPLPKQKDKKKVGIGKTVYVDSKPPKSGNRSRPSSGKSTSSSRSAFDQLMNADRDTLNLDLLMQAIMEMEEDRKVTHNKVMNQSMVAKNPTSINRKNLSFSNTRVKEIDRENQRLMQSILKHATMVKKKQKPVAQKAKPVAAVHAPSTVNRSREQKRIEQENFALLRRLNSAKADPSLQRDKQLQNFNNSKLFGVPLGEVHPSGPTYSRSRQGHSDLHSTSYSSLDASVRTYSRPSSAKSGGSRPPSAKLTGYRSGRPSSAKSDRSQASSQPHLSGKPKPRPAWDERW